MNYGRYELIDELGRGGMATVYLARDPVLSRHVALKVIHTAMANEPTLEKRFTSEARACAALHHTNIIAIHDFGIQGDEQYLVMEHIDGPSLDRLVRSHKNGLEEMATAALFLQAAEGLAEAHSHGIVHRDIKPENMLITPDGVLKIADFGIARSQNDAGLTQTGALLGSPRYMSPEQVECLETGPASDMFSMGGTLFFSLTGQPPFPGTSVPTILLNVAQGSHPDLTILRPDLDPFWSGIINRLLEKDPKKRNLSAQALTDELRAFLGRKVQVNPRKMVREVLTSSGLNGVYTIPERPTGKIEEMAKSRASKMGTSAVKEFSQTNTFKISKTMQLGLVIMVGISLVVGVSVSVYLWFPPGEQVNVINQANDGIESAPIEPEPVAENFQTTTSKVLTQPEPAILKRMRDGWKVHNHEVITALKEALARPGEVKVLAREVRLQSKNFPQARNLLFQADYFVIASHQAHGEYAQALEAIDRYRVEHSNTMYDESIASIRESLLNLKAAGLF